MFQAWRSTGLVDRLCSRLGRSTSRSIETCVQDLHGLCTSVGRPTGRPTESRLLSVFGRSTESVDRQFKTVFALCGRSTSQSTEPCVQDVHGLCTSVSRPTGRPTESRLLFVFGRSTGPVDRQFKTVFALCGRSTDRSTEPNGYLPDGLPVDLVGRPTACLEPQRLFPLW